MQNANDKGSGYANTTYLTMEASEKVVRSNVSEAKSLKITPIANIRAELKLFNAVFTLNRSPLKSLILDPISYREPTIPNRIPRFNYTGYVSICVPIYNRFKPLNTNKQLMFRLLIFIAIRTNWMMRSSTFWNPFTISRWIQVQVYHSLKVHRVCEWKK